MEYLSLMLGFTQPKTSSDAPQRPEPLPPPVQLAHYLQALLNALALWEQWPCPILEEARATANALRVALEGESPRVRS